MTLTRDPKHGNELKIASEPHVQEFLQLSPHWYFCERGSYVFPGDEKPFVEQATQAGFEVIE